MKGHPTRTRSNLLIAVFRPIARLAIRNAIHVSELTEALKTALVEESERLLRESRTHTSVGRVSLMTGLTRREAARRHRGGAEAANTVSPVARAVFLWSQDARFVGPKREPRALSFSGESGEFKELAREISKDVNPSTLLFEMKRLGVVEHAGDEVRLKQEVLFLNQSSEEGLQLLYHDIQTLTRAVEENLMAPRPIKNLHLRTEYNNIARSKVDEVRRWLLREGADLHRRTREMLGRVDKDLNPELEGEGGVTVVLGTFSWTDDEASDKERSDLMAT